MQLRSRGTRCRGRLREDGWIAGSRRRHRPRITSCSGRSSSRILVAPNEREAITAIEKTAVAAPLAEFVAGLRGPRSVWLGSADRRRSSLERGLSEEVQTQWQ
jgi:hypothetical protein